MSVSKKRHSRSAQQRHRERERLEIKDRATFRQHRFSQAIDKLCEADGTIELEAAIRCVQKIVPDKKELLSTFLYATPADILAHRRGWKSITNVFDDDDAELWIYTPSIPKDWDEHSVDQPTELTWDGDYYTLTPTTRGGIRSSGTVYYDNPFRLIREVSMIESW